MSVAGNFNSQPHEEADKGKQFINFTQCISTHSLTKRLTVILFERYISHRYFNSQPHEEADCSFQYFQQPINISTHSLTKRLTCVCVCVCISTHSLTKRLTSSVRSSIM